MPPKCNIHFLSLFFIEEMWVVIGAGAVTAAFGNGLGAFHHERAAGFAVAEK